MVIKHLAICGGLRNLAAEYESNDILAHKSAKRGKETI